MFGCLVPSISAYAVGDSWSSGQSYTYFQNNFDDINTRLNGVIINQNQLRESFEDFLEEYRDDYNIPSGTSNSTWIGDNISGTYQNGSSGVSDLAFSETFRQAMRDWCNTYIETNTGFVYGFSSSSAQYLQQFSDQDKFHAWLDVLNANQGKIIITSSSSSLRVLDGNVQFVADSYESSYGSYNTSLYVNWQQSDISYTEYVWNGSTYVSTEYSNFGSGRINVSKIVPMSSGLISFYSPNLVSLNTLQVQLYKSTDAMRNGTEGVQDYYVTDSYNSSISGSYNTTTSNIENTIGSNNVNNYINNYYVENGKYPTPNQINIYINNYTGDNNGGGSGDDDDNKPDWDFGFLGTLGELLAELISGLGEIVGGILSAITSIISSLREGIPNTIGLFLEWFFPFLPAEIVGLIELSILCMVIIGVVRLIRGH